MLRMASTAVRGRSYGRIYKTVAFAFLLVMGEIGLLSFAAWEGQGHPPVPFDWLGFSSVVAVLLLTDFFLIYYFSTWVSESQSPAPPGVT